MAFSDDSDIKYNQCDIDDEGDCGNDGVWSDRNSVSAQFTGWICEFCHATNNLLESIKRQYGCVSCDGQYRPGQLIIECKEDDKPIMQKPQHNATRFSRANLSRSQHNATRFSRANIPRSYSSPLHTFLPFNDADSYTKNTERPQNVPQFETALLRDIDEQQYLAYYEEHRNRLQSHRDQRLYNAVLIHKLLTSTNRDLSHNASQLFDNRNNIFIKLWYCMKDKNNNVFYLPKNKLDEMLFIAGRYYAREDYYDTFRHDAIGNKDPKYNFFNDLYLSLQGDHIQQTEPYLYSTEKLDYQLVENISDDEYYDYEKWDEEYDHYAIYDEDQHYDIENTLRYPRETLIFGVGVHNAYKYITKFYYLNETLYGAAHKAIQYYYRQLWYSNSFDACEQAAILFTYGIFTQINTLREMLYLLGTDFWMIDPLSLNVPIYNQFPINWHQNFDALWQRLGMNANEREKWKNKQKNGKYFNKMNCRKFLWLIGNLLVHYNVLSNEDSDCIYTAMFDILSCFSFLPRFLECLRVHLRRQLKGHYDAKSKRARMKLKNLRKDLKIIHYLIKYLYRDEIVYKKFLMDGLLRLLLRSRSEYRNDRKSRYWSIKRREKWKGKHK